MANVEQGQMTASSSFSKTPQPQVEPRPALPTNQSAPEGEVFYTTTAIGLVQKLTNLCGTKQGHDVESLALGHIIMIPEQATRELLPIVIEWMRSPRNIGCEGLALSLLSAAQAYFPGLYQPALAALASVPNSPYKAGPRLMVDLSASNRVLLSYFLSSRFTSIIEALLADPTTSVGMLVRKIAISDPDVTGFELEPLKPVATNTIGLDKSDFGGGGGGYDQCLKAATAIGFVAGAGAGFTMGGGVPGGIVGGLGGAKAGYEAGKIMCGWHYNGKPENALVSPNGTPRADEGIIGSAGDWCWTIPGWIIPGIPRPRFPVPPFITTFPLPRPIPPIFDPPPLPVTTPEGRLHSGIQGMTETAEASPVRPTVVIGERLSLNLCLVHL